MTIEELIFKFSQFGPIIIASVAIIIAIFGDSMKIAEIKSNK